MFVEAFTAKSIRLAKDTLLSSRKRRKSKAKLVLFTVFAKLNPFVWFWVA